MSYWLHRSALGVVLFFVTAAACTVQAQNTGRLIFEDDFTAGSLNTTYWDPFMTDNNANGWPWFNLRGQPVESSSIGPAGRFRLDYDLPSFISTGSGLTLKALKASIAHGFTWTGSVISSYPDTHFTSTQGVTLQNAYVEVKAKLPYTGNGMWPAIWFLPAPGSNDAEIDLQEGGFLDGTIDPDHIFACNYFGPGNSQQLFDTGANISDAYHIFGMAYKQNEYIKIYFDGRLMCNFTASPPMGAYYLILNNTVADSNTSGWHSQTTGSTASPNYMTVAYVKVYNLN
jgi:hypothetical protein